MGGKKCKFYVERGSFGVHAMMILMALSVVFRLIGCWGLWNERNYAVLQIALPVFSALLLIALVWLFGRRALWLSFLPVLLGAVFFIAKSLSFESLLHTILCIVLYVAVIVLYFCTVFGIIRTKWVLVALFGLPFLYHVFVEDLPALRDTVNPVSFAAGMQEMSVLCIILGLFFLALALKKEVTEAAEEALPGIKGPKAVFPKRREDSSADSSETVPPPTVALSEEGFAEAESSAGFTSPKNSETISDSKDTHIDS